MTLTSARRVASIWACSKDQDRKRLGLVFTWNSECYVTSFFFLSSWYVRLIDYKLRWLKSKTTKEVINKEKIHCSTKSYVKFHYHMSKNTWIVFFSIFIRHAGSAILNFKKIHITFGFNDFESADTNSSNFYRYVESVIEQASIDWIENFLTAQIMIKNDFPFCKMNLYCLVFL